MEHHSVAIGGKIYSLRVAKGMTQEQLAAILCILDSRINMTRLVPQLRVLHKSQPA